MSDTLQNINRKIAGARKLESVVRTMKILAASNIGQYEAAIRSLGDYYHSVRLGLNVCLSRGKSLLPYSIKNTGEDTPVLAVVYGSDQGLVGQYNDILADYSAKSLNILPGRKYVWAVGERIRDRLLDFEIPIAGTFDVPPSIKSVSSLCSKILFETQSSLNKTDKYQFYIFNNSPGNGVIYEPAQASFLPLDEKWAKNITDIKWAGRNLPEIVKDKEKTIEGLIREYLFVSLFKASAEALMSENAARLAAMQRAEKNIQEVLEDLTMSYNRLRQESIDNELFDVISGSEVLINS
ncbi:MAG TPA: F0F1 ATP synthase subunit gamma [Lentisphaeria bacterium]|nr:MAG: F0F1 ATP synthase subunit gamma [Lentisphaerae bacterium GWF2_38_69]HBM15282.1 F0F1 ATP synthase subunit gamma [Lentisphaeria bacterium]